MSPKIKKPTKSQAMRMADRRFSEYWVKKIGHCERCGRKNTRLELAHFKGREYKIIRYERRNTLVLCGGINIANCHVWAHNNPDLFKDFFVYLRGSQDLDWINTK